MTSSNLKVISGILELSLSVAFFWDVFWTLVQMLCCKCINWEVGTTGPGELFSFNLRTLRAYLFHGLSAQLYTCACALQMPPRAHSLQDTSSQLINMKIFLFPKYNLFFIFLLLMSMSLLLFLCFISIWPSAMFYDTFEAELIVGNNALK